MGSLIYRLNEGPDDDGTDFAFGFKTQAVDLGDQRAEKLWLDYMVDVNPDLVDLTLTPLVNNLAVSLASTLITGRTARQQIPVDIIQPSLQTYRDLGLYATGISTGRPVFYEFEPNALLQPYLAVNFTTQYQSHGFTTYGHLRDGYFVWISTTDITVTIITDLGLTYSLTLPSSSGTITKQYFPLATLKGLLFYYSAVSESPFMLFTNETIIHGKEWGSTAPYLSIKPWQGQTA